jgi:very-short-patch-repair endonuclease
MPLSWNEIKIRALAFSREWAHTESEDADAKSFWDAFFNVFGVSRRRFASFEQRVKKIDGKDGYIDLLWKGVVLVEHKSRGKDLDRAYQQARDYFPGLKDAELPRYIVVSDFARFRLHDLETGESHEFPLAELHKHVKRFGFIAGYQTHVYKDQDPVNIKAAEKMGRLHDRLRSIGYDGHPLQLYLVRLLFCLFADDTGIFERALFMDWLSQRTSEDGSDLAPRLAELFQVLNTPPEKRLKTLDEQITLFPYINGKLFEEHLPMPAFDAAMREALLDACALDWSAISPAIFGALFQSIMDEKARRNLGAHYTSEKNIQKLIGPLFLDELRAEFEKVKGNRNRLFEFHKKLRTLKFLDPACGCGNFLVITYRELRLLELDVLRAARTSGQLELDVHKLIQLDVDQFYGIEIEEFPAQIAQVALWLMDHQMNLKVSEEFGMYFARIPLVTSANIVHGNALRLDWDTVLPREQCNYVLGNPPFVGAKFMDDAQRADVQAVFTGIDNSGLLDFVAAWYVKAARYLHPSPADGRPAPYLPPSPAGGRGAGGEGFPAPHAPSTVPATLLANARSLRKTATDAESLLWHLLRNRGLAGAKFRRQHPEAGYVLDFYCDEARLAVELDGGQHAEQQAYDERRSAVLAERGIRVLRFWNDQVFKETEAVLEQIYLALQAPSPGAARRPLPPAGEASHASRARAAFVSTNSICQGEQVGVLWSWMLAQGIKIHFAHRTFSWSNEARGVAAVHCVIVGFMHPAPAGGRGAGGEGLPPRIIYDYEDIKGEPQAITARNINPYLVDAPDIFLERRSRPISAVPEMKFGNQPIDGGHLILTPAERDELLRQEPQAKKWLRLFLGADEYINGQQRYCLWLQGADPSELRALPNVGARIAAVRKFRAESKRAATRELANTPSQFAFVSHEDRNYIIVPSVSSERRTYIPMGFMRPDTIASNLCLIIPGANLFHFGILTSTMHMAWVRTVCGRLESRYRYSAGIVYNNFPWPLLDSPSPQRAARWVRAVPPSRRPPKPCWTPARSSRSPAWPISMTR